MTLNLDPSSFRLHIVDGNSFLLHLFRQSPNGLTTRQTLGVVEKLRLPSIWVFDGRGGNDRRREIYPAYKSKRTSPGEDLFASIRLFREGLRHTQAIQVECPGWEADDVVASIATNQSRFHARPVRVVTVDRDLYQLADDPRIEVTAKYEHVEANEVRLYKTFVGDPSDNIAGVPRFGDKAWERLNKSRARAVMVARQPFVAPEELGLSPAHGRFYMEHFEQLLIFWDIVKLFTVPPEIISTGTLVGKPDAKALDAALKEFLL